VRLTAREEGPEVVLAVADTGPGLGEDEREHVFAPYGRGQAAHRADGAGLGLAVVARLVALHGGRIAVQGTPGAGTTFEIRLPAGPRHGAAGPPADAR